MKLLDKYKGMASVLVFNGKTCLFWDDVWNDQVRRIQYPELHSFAKNKRISLSTAHDTDYFHDLFHLPLSIEAYNQMQELQVELSDLTLDNVNDSWTYIWGSSHFSSSKAYKILTGHSQIDPIFKWLWKTSCQSKHKVFFWLVLKDRLSTRSILRRRRMHLDDYYCVLCQQPSEETIMHLLFYCPFSKDCWGLFNFQYADQLTIPEIFREWQILHNASFSLDIFILVCWAIWVMRNDIIFRNKNPTVADCKRTITVESLLLLHRTKATITPNLEAWINSNL